MIDAEHARQIAVETLKEIGGEQESVAESWLVRGGYVVGRRFVCGGFSAVWFCSENEVKVYDQTGKFLKVVAVSEMGREAA